MARWVGVFGGLCLVALASSAAVPTQDTLVVARSDDTIATTATSVEEVTTEESSPPIKLTEMEVTSEVSLRYAHTTVVARMRNPAKRAQEANFRVLLPETAFISGFVMTLDGTSYKAYVKEKEEAKKIYTDAVSHGFSAAHVSAKARDSNHFTVSVNIEALTTAVFNLTYEELLVRRNSVYNHAINLHPGALVPKLTVTVHIKEAEKITELRVPEVRTGNEIDATKDDTQNSRAVIVKGHDDREVTITFTPDLQEQERLIQIYAQKSKESAAATHSFSWYDPEPEAASSKGVLGQFVVQYDVARPKDGEVLVNDGYFVHFFAPSDLQPLNKFVVFVLDTSGSMMDRKIVQLREAMQTILSELNIGDYFSIVEFASSVTVHSLKEADGEPPKHTYSYFDYDKETTLVPPSQATPENVAKAKLIVSWLHAAGGTNIDRALDVAVELINKGVDWTLPEKPPIATQNSSSPDGTSSSTTAPTPTTTASEVTTLTTEDKKPTKSLEPIIIFLTDGDPTVGETDPKRIITRVQEKNYGENKAAIYSLAFGEDADRKFMRKLSLRNGGFMRHIYEAADAALQLRDFYRQIASPLLAHLKFTYPTGQVKSDSLTKHDFRTYYAGSELVVAGRVEENATEITPQVGAFCGVGDGYGRKRYELVPRAPVEKKRSSYLPLERLWSYLTIKQLLDKHDAGDATTTAGDEKSVHQKKALDLALKYSFVTPLTSLVVVKPNATNAVNAESVDKAAGDYAASGLPLSITSNLFARPMVSHMPAPNYDAFLPSAADSQVDALEEEVDDYEFNEGFGGAPGAYGPSSSSSGGVRLHSSLLFLPKRAENFASGLPFSTTPLPPLCQDTAGGPAPAFGFAQSSIMAAPSLGHAYPSSTHFGASLFSGYRSAFTPLSGYSRFDVYPSSFGYSGRPLSWSNNYSGFPSHTSDLSRVAQTIASTTVKPALADLHLERYTWVEPMLDTSNDTLLLSTNGTTVSLKLSKDSIPREPTGDVECASAVNGGAGVCVYLTRCYSAQYTTVDVYSTTYCTVNQSYAGICCQRASVDIVTYAPVPKSH